MKTSHDFHFSGWLPILSASLLLMFWIFFAVFIPMQEEYIYWVLDKDWLWVNIIGFCGSLFGVFAITAIVKYKGIKSTYDILAYGSSIIGIIFLTSILFFEAFILKGIARVSPEIVNLNIGFYQEPVFYVANLVGGILFSVGIVTLAARLIIEKTFAKWKLISLIIGAPLFGIMMIPGNLRILGVLLYSVASIGIGIEILKGKRNIN